VPGDPDILYNIWDVGSARCSCRGCRGVGHGQPSGCGRQWAPDCQHVPLDFAFANAKRIVG
jgi:hypothetical protein